MKTSWSESEQIEDYFLGKMSVEDRLVFEAKLMTSPLLRMNVAFQKKTYSLIKMYGRKKLREEVETIHRQLFYDPRKTGFRESIMRYFKNSGR